MESDRNQPLLLWAEDHEGTRSCLSTILALNFPTLGLLLAENGEQGLTLFRRHHPDLILTDLEMPRMGGLQMTREIRGLGYRGDVILLTAHGEPELLREAAAIGVELMFPKPFEVKDLVRTIAECLAKTGSFLAGATGSAAFAPGIQGW